jgi:hypothetical protein
MVNLGSNNINHGKFEMHKAVPCAYGCVFFIDNMAHVPFPLQAKKPKSKPIIARRHGEHSNEELKQNPRSDKALPCRCLGLALN